MRELTIAWRNPDPVSPRRTRRTQKHNFYCELYTVQELVSSIFPELWLTVAAYEVHNCSPRSASAWASRPDKFHRNSSGSCDAVWRAKQLALKTCVQECLIDPA